MRRLPESGWEADLGFVVTSGEDLGRRTLKSRAASCAALKDPVSLVIALIVGERDPQATLQIPSIHSPSEPSAAPPAESAAEIRTAMSAGFALSSGLLPRTAYGVGIDWAAEVAPWLAAQVGGGILFPQVTERRPGGEIWAWLATVAFCPRVLASESADGWLCLGGRAGGIHGAGVSMAGINGKGSQVTRPYGDVDAHAKVSFPVLGSLALMAQLGLAFPWLRPRFIWTDDATDTFEVVHQPNAAVLFATVGVELGAHGRQRLRGATQ